MYTDVLKEFAAKKSVKLGKLLKDTGGPGLEMRMKDLGGPNPNPNLKSENHNSIKVTMQNFTIFCLI